MTRFSGNSTPFKPARPDGRARTELVSFRLIPAGAQKLKEMAKERGISRGELVRRALTAALKADLV